MKFAYFKSTIVFGALLFASNRFVVASEEEDLGGGGDGDGAAIVGGAPATTQDFFVQGYATMLNEDGKGGCCGAHLIAPDLLLTAGHCKPCFASYLGNIFGSVSIGGLLRDTTDGEVVSIAGFRLHPDYAFPKHQNPSNDIMIVSLASRTTKQIATWNTDSTKPAVGETIQLVGFGRTVPEDANSLPVALQKGQVTIAEPNTCTNFTAINFCAAGGNGVGTCKGDSGSPVFDLQTGQILGITSFGPPVCTDGPGKGFTRVSAFHDWIIETACEMTREVDPKPAFCLAPANAPSPAPNEDVPLSAPTKAPSASVKDPRTGEECPFSGDFADFLCLLWLIWTWFLSLFAG